MSEEMAVTRRLAVLAGTLGSFQGPQQQQVILVQTQGSGYHAVELCQQFTVTAQGPLCERAISFCVRV